MSGTAASVACRSSLTTLKHSLELSVHVYAMLKEMLDQLEDRLDDLDRVFQALADPSRLSNGQPPETSARRLSASSPSRSRCRSPRLCNTCRSSRRQAGSSGPRRPAVPGPAQLAPDVLQGADDMDQRAANRLGASSRSPRPLPRREPGRNRQMTQRSVTHSHFTIERSYEASPGRVVRGPGGDEGGEVGFGSMAPRAAIKASTSSTSVSVVTSVSAAVRPAAKCTPSSAGITTSFPTSASSRPTRCTRTTCAPPCRSPAFELVPNGSGTKLTYTEHGAFLDGLDSAEGREDGTIQAARPPCSRPSTASGPDRSRGADQASADVERDDDDKKADSHRLTTGDDDDDGREQHQRGSEQQGKIAIHVVIV